MKPSTQIKPTSNLKAHTADIVCRRKATEQLRGLAQLLLD